MGTRTTSTPSYDAPRGRPSSAAAPAGGGLGLVPLVLLAACVAAGLYVFFGDRIGALLGRKRRKRPAGTTSSGAIDQRDRGAKKREDRGQKKRDAAPTQEELDAAKRARDEAKAEEKRRRAADKARLRLAAALRVQTAARRRLAKTR
ncbi:hypothetical protein M885DRAFT_568323, partial [Pelagophyceae sp. CCMP2097]